MKTNLIYATIALALFLAYSCTTIFGNGDDDLSDLPILEDAMKTEKGEVIAEIAHLHDLISPDYYFVNVLSYPGAKWPKITGGYADTEVECVIKLRGVDVPSACQVANARYGRLPRNAKRERQRWDHAMQYVWNLVSPNKAFKLTNYKLIEDDIVETDVEFWTGRKWHDLREYMVQDAHAMPFDADTIWTWGERNVSPMDRP